jgi:hypothetical protein
MLTGPGRGELRVLMKISCCYLLTLTMAPKFTTAIKMDVIEIFMFLKIYLIDSIT